MTNGDPSMEIKIDNRAIGGNNPCFVVAEIGINHNGDIDLAKEMIREAKKAGVDAVKFQIFKAEEFVSDRNEIYEYYSQGKKIRESMYEMFKRHEFSPEEWKEIFKYANNVGIFCFATPQNPSDLELLLSIADPPLLKVGSDDLTNLPLLEYYSKKNKPIMISTGMAYLSEIEDAINTIRDAGNRDIIVLHCVSSYPAKPEELNLLKIKTLKSIFKDVIVGYSDHSIGTTSAVVAVTLGAKVVEKHFTLDKNLPGPDHWFSADVEEFRELVEKIRYIEKALGSGEVKPSEYELEMRKIARRSIVAARDIKAGEIITDELLAFKRPGTGLSPKFIKFIKGKTAKCNIKEGELITFDKVC